MARRFRSTRVPNSMKRRLMWADSVGSNITISDTNRAARSNLLGDYQTAAGGDVEGVTVTRIRGTIWWVPKTTAVQEYNQLVLGLKVGDVDDGFVGTGITDEGQVTSATSPHRDWMLFRRQWVHSSSADAGVFSQVDPWPTHLDIDLKSQRRFDELNQTLFLYYAATPALGSGNEMGLFWHLRVLLKRP